MIEKSMNVLFLASWYPSEVSAQNGNFIQQHARAVSQFCHVAVLHAVSRKQNEKIVIDQKWNRGIFEVIVYYKKISSTFPLFANYLKLQRQKQAYLSGYKVILKEISSIDIVHLNVLFPAGIFALHLKQKYNIPFIVTEHWTALLKDIHSEIGIIKRYFIRKTGNASSLICPVSHDLKRALIRFGIKTTYRVIPNVVDTDLFYPSPGHLKNDKVKMLHISTLNNSQKNINGILNTIKKLNLKRNDFELHIVSDQDISSALNYAKKINMPDELIRFHGMKTSEEVAEMMRENDFFILFSNYENLPCVLIEALASGLPVVSSDVGGISEIINNDNGILVKPGDERAFYSAINTMLDRHQYYKNNQLRQRAVEQFSYQSVGQKYLDAYKEIVG